MNNDVDVAIIGGGPAGSTAGTLLRKYAPNLSVTIFERERFPRDHVGESQLPLIGRVLDEMGVWNAVEAANFPIKVGATYRWGTTDDLWDFDFIAGETLTDRGRPSRYEGVRRDTAFQVDRAKYDKILLDHAKRLGCKVREETAIREIIHVNDRVEALRLDNGEEIRPRYVIDGSGGAGIVRRALGVEISSPTSLRNIAIWRYWDNAEWAVKIGVGGTRVFVMSLGYGWIWFIPLGPTRTSVGLIVPAEYYKSSGERPEALYEKAMGEDPMIAGLLKNANAEPGLFTTKDWSFVADRTVGENWFLAGESAGFADPILAAGMTLAHQGAREAAYTIAALEQGREDPSWLRQSFDEVQRRRLSQHIRFADYWYRANANFTELKDYVSEIARDAGLELNGDQAFQWLGTGGFIEEDMEVAGLALLRMDQLHSISGKLSEKPVSSALDGYGLFLLRLSGAEEVKIARFEDGGVKQSVVLRRDGKVLPMNGLFGWLVDGLQHSPRLDVAIPYLARKMSQAGYPFDESVHARLTECLDAMIRDGWVKPKRSTEVPSVRHEMPMETAAIHQHVPDRGDGA